MPLVISEYVALWGATPFAHAAETPWQATSAAQQLIIEAIARLPGDYQKLAEVAVHETAEVEENAQINGPAIIGPHCFVSGRALLRGGVFLDEGCVIGPGVEIKSSFMFRGAKVTHLSFVGDSILGAEVNVEGGAMIANRRNEFDDKRIVIAFEGGEIDTGVEKFGALIGDGCRIGANAVIAPGALVKPGSRVPRLGLVDLWPGAASGRGTRTR